MKRLGILLVALVIGTGVANRAEAANISLFMNTSYVDTGTEGANLQATLVGLGHTVGTFTGITAAAFTAAGATGIIILPEMELDNLFTDLDAAARAALQAFVSGGGTLIQANYFVGNSNLANGLFGYALSQTGNIGATNLNAAAAAGTPFAGGPAVLPGSNAVEGVATASLPGGALNLYSAAGNTSVFMTSFGAGHYIYLGYDWFGGNVPEWAQVLDRAIDQTAVPEPASMLLVGAGLLYGAHRVRRSRRG